MTSKSKVNFIIHFAKHRNDKYIQMEYDPLGYYALSIAAYLGAIGNYPDWPRVGTTSLGGSKYKSITTKRYVIIEIEGKENIASFGGN